jgi:hypothetical protein
MPPQPFLLPGGEKVRMRGIKSSQAKACGYLERRKIKRNFLS